MAFIHTRDTDVQRQFSGCKSLTSIFIPPSCRKIQCETFKDCKKLLILSIPEDTLLGNSVFENTELIERSPFTFDGSNSWQYHNEANQWTKNINQGDAYALHRVCSAFDPLENDLFVLLRQHGLGVLRLPNSIGITPMQYLEANPYANIDQSAIMKRYIMKMMGLVDKAQSVK